VLGTRPEIIKFSPVIRELKSRNENFFIIHTGQHYSYEMDRIFFQELHLPEPKYNLNVGSGTHAETTGKILINVEQVLQKEEPDVVLVQGDTNTVLATALAATKLKLKVGHVEAGLRSGDWRQPEEKNRIIASHISDYLFAPTKTSAENLMREGLPRSKQKIWITGNTVVDAVKQNLSLSDKSAVNKLGLEPKNYFLVTAHREEYVDAKTELSNMLKGLELVYKNHGILIIWPIHPRTRKRLREFNLEIPEGLHLIDPIGYLEFLQLESNAKLILTDSGGVQEEACILGVPCVVLRDFSDRPETIGVGAAMLAGTNSDKILFAANQMLTTKKNWENPFGDGNAGKKILDILNGELLKEQR
jgi:UDP-N-acetylglucosamine 2-epimerase (non-hydrolysing)